MKIRNLIAAGIGLFVAQVGCAQAPPNRPEIANPAFDKKLTQLLGFHVPLIGVSELKNIQENIYIFDTRELTEYKVSHIKNAKHLGYDHFDPTLLADTPKDATIVLYCSVGYRSEKIGEKLLKMGYKKVYNLYGSIFEWVNQGNPVVDKNGKTVKSVHTYNKTWSKWLDNKQIEKVW